MCPPAGDGHRLLVERGPLDDERRPPPREPCLHDRVGERAARIGNDGRADLPDELDYVAARLERGKLGIRRGVVRHRADMVARSTPVCRSAKGCNDPGDMFPGTGIG